MNMKNKKRGESRNNVKTSNSNTKTFIQFLTPALIIMSYFIIMFVLSLLFTKKTFYATREMNLFAQAEPYYSFALNI